MSAAEGNHGPDPTASDAGASEPPFPAAEWTDSHGQAWRIDLQPGRITLRNEENLIELPADTWAQDVYLAQHGSGYIVRFSTFEAEIGFVVAAGQVRPLIEHLSRHLVQPAEPPQTGERDAPQEQPSRQELLWPKVSPLAVWALVTASLVFLPFVGFAMAIATILLLTLHRRKVRKAQAWAHSRALCLAAFVFLAAGLPVSALSSWGFSRNASKMLHVTLPTDEPPPAGPNETAAVKAQQLSQTLVDRIQETNWALVGAALLVVLLSLTVHEASHAITAWWMGDDFARRIGRVTLNPVPHIDPFGTVLLPLILFLVGWGVFGWAKPVPVRMDAVPNPRRAHILVSLAGPGSNLLLAAASLLLLLGLGCAVGLFIPDAEVANFADLDFGSAVTASGFPLAWLFGALCTILKLSFLINVFLAFFNLIPIPPLDGSWVLEHLFPRRLGELYRRVRPFSLILFLILIYSDLLMYLLIPGIITIMLGLGLLWLSTPF
jgi:Zn-dependent protease